MRIMHPLEKGSNLCFPVQQETLNQHIIDVLISRKEGMTEVDGKGNFKNVEPDTTTCENGHK